MSIANPPVYSNGNKTVSITMKSNYKWSDGKPITANDLLFAIDLIKAAVKVSPANWAIYTPGQFPDTLVSTSEPNASTLVMNLSGPVNPSWFTQNELGAGPPPLPMPSFLWAKTSTSWLGHPAVRLDAGQHDEDLQLPDRAEQVDQHLRDQPAVAGGRRTVQAHVLQRDQRRVHDGAEHHLRRPARDADVHLPGRPVHLERRAVQRHQGGQHRRRLRRLHRRAAAAQRAQERLQLLRHPRLRHELRQLQLQGHDRRLQQHHRPAVYPPGARPPGGRPGLDPRVHERGRRRRLRARSRLIRGARTCRPTRRSTHTRSACRLRSAC